MTLEDVIAQVTRDGQRDASEIQKRAGQEALRILGDADASVRRVLAEAEVRAKQEAQRLRELEISSAETEAAKIVMSAKRALFDKSRNIALRTLATMPRERKEALLSRLLRVCQRETPGGTVHCTRDEEGILRALAQGMRLIPDLQGAGGIVAESMDGRVVLTMSYESLLEDVWGQALPEVAKVLEI